MVDAIETTCIAIIPAGADHLIDCLYEILVFRSKEKEFLLVPKQIEKTEKNKIMIDKLYLFSWDEIPGKDSEKLLEFLKQNFCIDYVNPENIKKSDDNRTIRATTGKKYLSIELNNEKTKAILTIDNFRAYEFNVITENNKLNLYNECMDLVHIIQCKEQMIRNYLNSHRGKYDPVKFKHLEIIVGHLQSILMYINSLHNSQSDARRKAVSLISILKQINEPFNEISAYDAWELSDLLGIELIRLGDDVYIYILLKAQKIANNTDTHRWEKHFPVDDLNTLIENYKDGKFQDCNSRIEARCFLEYLRQVQIEEYRYDRAKIDLRGKYITYMTVILFVLLLVLSYSYYKTANPPFYLLLLVLSAGAVGSVLSNAFKLGKQPLHAETDSKTSEPPLGIRTLISQLKVFWAQLFTGAAAALILFLVFNAGMVQFNAVSEPAAYGIIAFLAGFSEAYFIGIIDKVIGQTGGPLR